jgi:glycosyltransferase involved in cell wall biosynthesis
VTTSSRSSSHVFVCGYPGDVGGANTELWHTVKLWRSFGLDVTLIPTWQADARWQARLQQIGCRTVESSPDRLRDVPGLAGAVVVSMCNTRFLAAAEQFRELGCRIAWVGCMNWLYPRERLHYRQYGVFDRHVFQSHFQHDQLAPQLRRFGYQQRHGQVIRGALAAEEFSYSPLAHGADELFTIGRLSRAAADKFSPRTWQIYGRVPHPVRARVLGWAEEVRARLGPPPHWAECLPAGSQVPQQFLPTLHAMVHAGGQATENWPRVGLEAMAAGVPVIADDRGGWPELIRHGRTGYLCRSDDQFAYYTARLAYDEEHRLEIARQARASLEAELANPEVIWAGWSALLGGLSG